MECPWQRPPDPFQNCQFAMDKEEEKYKMILI